MLSQIIKRIIPRRAKYIIKTNLGVPSQEDSLKRIRLMGFDPLVCLDIGAYKGTWAVEFKHLYPKTRVLMIEAQVEKEPELKRVTAAQAMLDYKIALLGACEQEVPFHKYETASSVLTEHHDTGAATEIRKLSTLDQLLIGTDFCRPDFIKIDTQGYELEILKGGQKTLSFAQFVLLEVSFLDIYKDAPLVADVVEFMEKGGFVLYDICTLIKRPLDGALYQSDFLFCKKDSPFRDNKRWSA